ncbi:uncharacterized protein PITG_18715 [Phytophthora infestans T30-4]|uniref:Transmembrane protein n=1 Tax=Phytophthora infestans (strain T30-4) TaxID=403677 RepID=D0NZ27_PHYIT|nr:uncharacterized protein PITG_18715 [Phytophthora infestans T30-4]EEY68814.1 hypothetical protein PITG_18715 [Phytophthora infestans T30-4]|eukprot:XP_002997364.1 hypothetical protein PITG_18715 [Phytophthora infestans T30-4]
MRAAVYALQGFLAATTTMATSYNPQYIVLGTDGTVVEADPRVYGSVVFAELSCCFVAFIGYLVRSIPLWVSFSRGQKCCLVVAFSVALLYQFAAVGWFLGAVTPELMLGLSSLITRTISLGMVPITTTSFMGRARICQDHSTTTPARSRKSSHSRNSHRHHTRARSS